MGDNLMQIVMAVLIGYALGGIETAYIIGKRVGHLDIRKVGSENAGASNVTVILGWKYGILTGIFDALKGTLAVVLTRRLYPGNEALAYLAGMAAILGHIYPPLLGFRGGKGIATLIGVLTGVHPGWGALACLLVAGPALTVDYMAVGSIVVFTAFPIITWYLGYPPALIILSLIITGIVYSKHRSNFARIRAGTEVRVRPTFKHKPEEHPGV